MLHKKYFPFTSVKNLTEEEIKAFLVQSDGELSDTNNPVFKNAGEENVNDFQNP